MADAATALRGRLRDALSPWLLPSGRLSYDAVYGGVVVTGGPRDASGGNAAYAEHLTQYGPLLYAAAVAAKSDAGWASARRDALMALLRDVANPRSDGSDRFFPFARYMDWFEGHAWSSGLLRPADVANGPLGAACGRMQEVGLRGEYGEQAAFAYAAPAALSRLCTVLS